MATDTDGQEPAKQHLVNSGYTQIKQINHPVPACQRVFNPMLIKSNL